MLFKNHYASTAIGCVAIFVATIGNAEDKKQDKKPAKPPVAQCPVMGNLPDAHARQTAAGAMSNGDW